METLRVQVPAHTLHPRTEGPARQDSVSLESLVSAAALLTVFQPEVGHKEQLKAYYSQQITSFLSVSRKTTFLHGSQRSTAPGLRPQA